MYETLCDFCKKRPAFRSVTTYEKERKKQRYICRNCYMERQQSASLNVLKGIAKGSRSFNEPHVHLENVCSACGTTASRFLQTGLVGCNNCYVDLAPEISRMIKASQGQRSHMGKTPYTQKAKASVPPVGAAKNNQREQTKESMVLRYKKELEAAVQLEQYEKAIQLRDKLIVLEKEIRDAKVD